MKLLTLITLLGLAACVPEQEAEAMKKDPRVKGDISECNSHNIPDLVGQVFDASMVPQGALVRVIKPGDAVTMDFRPNRLNISLDAQGRVKSMRCG